MPLVAAAWSRPPRAATPPGAVTVGIQRQGQRKGRRQGQGQRNAGALQGWMVAPETPGADVDDSYIPGSIKQQFGR